MRRSLLSCLLPLVVACAGESGETSAAATVGPPASNTTSDAGGSDVDARDIDGALADVAVGDAANVPTPTGCVKNVSAGHHSFSCDGIVYEVEITPACAMGGCGLVLDVHGLTMNGNQEDKSSRLRAIGAPAGKGYVIVQPTAPAGVLGPSWNPATDDDKVWAALGELRTALLIDDHRIHVTGFSQGGAMSWRMLCKHADVIASAAPIASADATTLDSNVPPFRLDCPFDATTAPARPVPILQMHGTRDGLVPIAKGKGQRDAVLAWLGPVTKTELASDDHFTHTRYASASKNVVFEFLEHDYAVEPPLVPVPIAGHCFPGGEDLRAGGATASLTFSCAPPNAFVWGNVVMKFFVENPRP